jgi:hypothetical protein
MTGGVWWTGRERRKRAVMAETTYRGLESTTWTVVFVGKTLRFCVLEYLWRLVGIIPKTSFGRSVLVSTCECFSKEIACKTLLSPKTLCYTTITLHIKTLHLLICLEGRDKYTTTNSIFTAKLRMIKWEVLS